jgi:hypothetical protein
MYLLIYCFSLALQGAGLAFYTLCDAFASWRQVSEGLQREMQLLMRGYKERLQTQWESGVAGLHANVRLKIEALIA